MPNGTPIWARPKIGRREFGVRPGRIYDSATHHREQTLDRHDALIRHSEVIRIEYREAGKHATLKPALDSLLLREPGRAVRHELQCLHALQTVVIRGNFHAADSFSRRQPVQCDERIEAGNPSSIRAAPHGQAHGEHFLDGRARLCSRSAVAADKELTLICHAVLNGDSSPKPSHAFERTVADGFCVVEYDAQWRERDFGIDAFE